jgi:hypothetical protein
MLLALLAVLPPWWQNEPYNFILGRRHQGVTTPTHSRRARPLENGAKPHTDCSRVTSQQTVAGWAGLTLLRPQSTSCSTCACLTAQRCHSWEWQQPASISSPPSLTLCFLQGLEDNMQWVGAPEEVAALLKRIVWGTFRQLSLRHTAGTAAVTLMQLALQLRAKVGIPG